MLISAGLLRAAPNGASAAAPWRSVRVTSPAVSAVGGGGGVRSRRLAGVGLVAASSSAASPDELHARGRPARGSPEKSALWNLIKDIEPLDLSTVQKDVPHETVDAMKRTVSGMLGLLPSDQFSVVVEALWNPFFKLVVSSIMTGYTLCNAEYMLSLERTLQLSEEETKCQERENTEHSHADVNMGSAMPIFRLSEDELTNEPGKMDGKLLSKNMDGLDNLNTEAKDHIQLLQSRLDSMEKELRELKRKNYSLQMQQLAGEDKNELLDYLRSLSAEKVIELSEPSCPGVQEAINSMVHGLLATLSPKMHTKPPLPPSENKAGGALNFGKDDDDRAEIMEDVSLRFEPLISIPRDHLARLLFWCMLLGRYMRGLERRLELSQLLKASSDVQL